jgi:hypothetical protein
MCAGVEVRMVKVGTRMLIGAIGLGLLVAGAVKALSVSGNGGGLTLVVAGAVLLISPFILNRIERLSVTTTGFDLQLSREIVELGAPKTAQVLDRTELAKFAESYAFVYEELRDPQYRDARVHLLDVLVERAAAISRREKMNATEVRTLFRNGSPMLRVLTLGLMQGDPSLADGATIVSAIADSRSANEQFHGLRLALLCWHNLARSDRHAIQSAAKDSPYIHPGNDRQPLADQLLALPVALGSVGGSEGTHATPVDVGDTDMTGVTALAFAHF